METVRGSDIRVGDTIRVRRDGWRGAKVVEILREYKTCRQIKIRVPGAGYDARTSLRNTEKIQRYI